MITMNTNKIANILIIYKYRRVTGVHGMNVCCDTIEPCVSHPPIIQLYIFILMMHVREYEHMVC